MAVSKEKRAERGRVPAFDVKGEKLSFHDDLYPFILTLSWTQFFGLFILVFFFVNVFFAGVYSLFPHCVDNANGFVDNFFFSVETLATIGYGEMTPHGLTAHIIVTAEALVGIAATAMMTGLIFARFARPTAKVLFTDHMVIGQWNGMPHLMFRMANRRRNQMAEAQVAVMVLITEKTNEGHIIRKPTEVGLVRSRNPMFALTWTAMHPIDEKSPFHGPDAWDKLREMKADIFVTLTGFDETLMQTITARYRYALDDVMHNAHFADVVTITDDGDRLIDYTKFHDVVHETKQ
jgi:inward rectifier potassium channel